MAIRAATRSAPRRKKQPAPTKRALATAPAAMPDLGDILKGMRVARGLTVREVAAGSGLSASFLSAVERGTSDISLGRLARLATFFDQDIISLLGVRARLGRPRFVDPTDRVAIDRGKGVTNELLRLAGLKVELQRIVFDPRSGFREELVHDGADTVLVTEGQIVLSVDGVDYPMKTGDCATYAAGFRHRLRNDSARRATAVTLTTGRVF